MRATTLLLLLATGCHCRPEAPNSSPHGGTGDDTQGSPPPDSPIDDTGDSDAPVDPWLQPEVWVTPHELSPGDTATVHYRGALADQPSLSIRYGYNGYNQVEGIDDWLTWFHYANTDYYLEAEMTPVDGGFEYELPVPADARALQFGFFTGEEPHASWDDRDGLGYHKGVVFPYIGPYLTWNDHTPASTGVVINFETSLPCLGTVEYGPDPSLGRRRLGESLDTMHHIAITGLEPGSTVHYRVLDAGGQASEIHSFQTAPEDFDAFGFVVAADVQDHGDGGDRYWSEVAAEIATSHDDAALILMPGDLTLDDMPGDWWTFFDKGRALFAGRVLVPSVGNHDTPTDQHDPDESNFLRYFDLPGGADSDGIYRVDYGPAAFLAFNSEVEEDFAEGGAQQPIAEAWLADIQGDTSIRWVFAHWHTPPYNTGDRFSPAQQSTIRELTASFEGTVDWVFTGHEHLYQRTHPLRYEGVVTDSYGNGADQGVGYVVMPPAGIRQYDQVISETSGVAHYRDWMAYPEMPTSGTTVDAELGFVVVHIDRTSITLETYGMGTDTAPLPAHLVDSVSYDK